MSSAGQFFGKALLHWNSHDNDRDLPWKGIRDPYKIWLSEIMLQQTRASQAKPFFKKFIENYPTVTDLADAEEEEVFKLWEGLGYYSRCANLLHTARTIKDVFGGEFPRTHAEILGLKGVGPYTAAAISSFAFDLPTPVLDGNVYRVISRYFGESMPIDDAKARTVYEGLLERVFVPEKAAKFNQAIMDFGASICTPKLASCESCVLSDHCVAYAHDLVSLLPIKMKKLAVQERHFQYFLLVYNNEIYLHKRPSGDIWANLYEFYLVESTNFNLPAMLSNEMVSSHELNVYCRSQRLTHRIVRSSFHMVRLKVKPIIESSEGTWVSKTELKKFAFPKTIVSFLNEIDYF